MTEQPALLPSGHTAVMAQRQPTQTDSLDYFPTPPWAARAGAELIAQLDPEGLGVCWEPAFGGGHMAHGLADYFGQVLVSDIHDHDSQGVNLLDFLSPDADGFGGGSVDWIITNPPFIHGEAFIRAGWKRARRGVAMLLRLAFIETIGRYRLHVEDCPLTLLAPFSERVPMVKGRWDPDASSATAYAWFIYAKGAAGPTRLQLVPPGSAARLARPDDLVRFAGAAPQGNLFSERP
ncbi:MAG TPA: hypothetical protein VEA44_16135 [Caulobacter sp.]|nr:hypothetical protein [Caulobacter sp.]